MSSHHQGLPGETAAAAVPASAEIREAEVPSGFSEGTRLLSPKNQALLEPSRWGTANAAAQNEQCHLPERPPGSPSSFTNHSIGTKRGDLPKD